MLDLLSASNDNNNNDNGNDNDNDNDSNSTSGTPGISSASLQEPEPLTISESPPKGPQFSTSCSTLLDTTCMNLPGFITTLVTQIPAEDMVYLYMKGALTLPSADVQNALLRSFFDYVYPFMPILDLDGFTQSVAARNGTSGKLSLLLFQAVLFAGTAHVSMDHLRNAGFRTRRQARKTLFQRTRVELSLFHISLHPEAVPCVKYRC